MYRTCIYSQHTGETTTGFERVYYRHYYFNLFFLPSLLTDMCRITPHCAGDTLYGEGGSDMLFGQLGGKDRRVVCIGLDTFRSRHISVFSFRNE